MEQYFALIKKDIVEHVIVAGDDFLKHIEKDYDKIVDVSNMTRPQPGDSYYPNTNSFIPNHTDVTDIVADEPAPVLSFEPFSLSKYSVRHENGYVIIGCKHYSAAGFIKEVRKIAEKTSDTTSTFIAREDGPAHGKFGITWDDVQKLYEIIIKGQS